MQSLLALLPLRWPALSSGWRTLALFLSIAVPACFSLALVVPVGAYTASLSIFVVASGAAVTSLWRRGALRQVGPPLLIAWALLVPMGGALNLFFADDFFTYPNPSAVTGFTLPALDLTGVDLEHRVPVEELAFYGLGFLAMLLAYAWIGVAVFPRGDEPEHRRFAVIEGVVVPLALVLGGLLASETVPAYWIYLCVVPLPPTLMLWRRVRGRLNPAALLLTVVAVVAISIVWEAVLAVPRGWWGYQPQAVLGRTSLGVPLEAVIVWVLAPITTAVLYEFVRLQRRSR